MGQFSFLPLYKILIVAVFEHFLLVRPPERATNRLLIYRTLYGVCLVSGGIWWCLEHVWWCLDSRLWSMSGVVWSMSGGVNVYRLI